LLWFLIHSGVGPVGLLSQKKNGAYLELCDEREMILWVGVHGNHFSLGHGLSSDFEAPMKVNGVKLWH
jgi:hypothetical protein